VKDWVLSFKVLGVWVKVLGAVGQGARCQ